MKLIKYTAAALTLASFTPAQESALYEVTHLIIESATAVDVWTSEHFVRTDIQVTPDSIHYFEAVGEYNKMIKTESTDYSNVLSITDLFAIQPTKPLRVDFDNINESKIKTMTKLSWEQLKQWDQDDLINYIETLQEDLEQTHFDLKQVLTQIK